jgi:hypothetical protein
MNYGDYDNVTKDATKLIDILNRQGSHIFLEVLADKLAQTSYAYSLTESERNTYHKNICKDLKSLILERV